MPNKPPSDRTRAKGGPPTHITSGTVGGALRPSKIRNEPNFTRNGPGETPKMRNEPNLPLPQPGPRSKYTKRTQFAAPRCFFYFLLSPFLLSRGQQPAPPNLPPRSPCPTAKMRNEPNIRPAIMRNKPNFNRQAGHKPLWYKELRRFPDSSVSCGWAEEGFEFFFYALALAQGLADQDCAYSYVD